MSDVNRPDSGGSATRVKVCGVTRAADREAVVTAGADAVGVISDVPVDTPREVGADTAADLLAGVPPLVTGVLVTMPSTVEEAVDLVETVDPDAVQVHGGLSPGELGALGHRLSQDVIVAVDAAADDIADYADPADALLVDSVDAAGGGGTGETHDWERTREIVADLDVPVVLAGGLTPDNVAAAVETVRPFGVDVATGVERVEDGDRVGGEKDPETVREFVAAATRREVAA
ncbi:phosphoribosylanthranilate isomerase [Halosimplex carlsbadense 2-9-1]|uniref:N-(5'-phosphoribosyl)anthranilate isomerase n=1 Tax=Halosimplex carlsbadense 2-9-1 TaxID=797114 RepID=M0CIB1_9EURY|nr:phosphoribosylanthranilate isomerase [Halosimplex carlsbadense]ELZ22378.1 phosphoribosylanthranilate isomerase [Halosimplex carlsbadense 2-9-1]